MQPIRIAKHRAFYIPTEDLTKEQIKDAIERFTFRFYADSVCANCEYRPNRFDEENCGGCAAYKGVATLASTKIIGENEFLSLPRGGYAAVKEWLREHELQPTVSNKTPKLSPLKRRIRFTGTLRPYQETALERMTKRGIIESPPRSGKTAMGAAFVCQQGLKTLILGHQREWLDNFKETFVGSDTQEALTNAKPDQVGYCSTMEQFAATDVALATFQQFFSPKGKKLLKAISSMFNIVLIDEMQYSPAKESKHVVAALNATYMIGLTGTVERKDMRHVLAEQLIGPIVHKVNIPRMVPRVTLLETKRAFQINNRSPAAFVRFAQKVQNDKERRDLIIKKALALAKEGHFVFIPLMNVKNILDYTKKINYEAEERWARPFYGGLAKDVRRKTIEAARNYQFRILVGNIALVSVGLNIPRASAIIEHLPTSNLPKCEQRISRILTPHDSKPEPLIVLVLDDSDILRGMRRNEFWNCIYRKFKPRIDGITYERLKNYLSASSTRADIRDI